jgi:hypothetical protein
MAKPKECFGELANMAIRFRSQGGNYYLYKDKEKLKECDQCPYFSKCMFVKYSDMFEEMIKLLNEQRNPGSQKIRTRL